MNAIYRLIISINFLLWIANGQAQADLLRCELISQEQGLPDNSAWSLYEDHLGFLWVGTQLGLARYDGYQVKVFHFQSEGTTYQRKLPINVRTLTGDGSGDLWIGTAHGEVFRFDRQIAQFIPYFQPKASAIRVGPAIRKILADSSGYIWIAMGENGLERLKRKIPGRTFEQAQRTSRQHFPSSGRQSPGKIVWDIALDRQSRLWATTDRGLVRWEEEQSTFRIFPLPPAILKGRDDVTLGNLSIAPDGAIWVTIGGEGVLRFDPHTAQFETPTSNIMLALPGTYMVQVDSRGRVWLFENSGPTERIHIFDPITRKMRSREVYYSWPVSQVPFLDMRDWLEDRNGVMWIANHGGGLLKYRPEVSHFRWIQPSYTFDMESDPLLANHVLKDRQRIVWIATRRKGLLRWDRLTQTFTAFRHQPGNPNSISTDQVNCLAFSEDEQELWIATPLGIDRYDRRTGVFSHLNNDPAVPAALKDQYVRFLISDPHRGGFWITHAWEGVQYYDPVSGEYRLYKGAGTSDELLRVIAPDELFLDSTGKLWVGTNGSYFFHFDPTTEKWQHFDFPPGGDFWEDDRQTVWVGTYGSGLVAVNMQDLSWHRFDHSDGLPHNKVRSMMHDRHGKLWVGTNYGLAHFDPLTGVSRNFYKKDGIPANEFFDKAHLLLADGQMLFSTYKGMFLFHPDSIRTDTLVPQIVLTDFHIWGRPLAEVLNDSSLTDVTQLQSVQLQHDQNDLRVRFAAMNFRNPERNRYRVKLANYDDDWRPVSHQPFANYTKLAPGHYTLRVQAANSDGIWNRKGLTLEIVIRPPWYWNIWSKAIYMLMLVGVLMAIYRFQINRRLVVAETARLRELDEVKTKLYTNITHEFRTPLTVIQGVSEQIQAHDQEKEIIRRNSQNLLELVNRMLDLAKIEAGQLSVHMIQGDILSYLRYITESFHSLARNQKIHLHFYSDQETLIMDYDREKTLQILSNLISNAVKFTPEYGEVTITARKQIAKAGAQLEVKVKDTGVGIAPDQLSAVFGRFHQVDAGPTRRAEGTGIGLALTKELVTLLNGQIRVESQMGAGSTFTVLLPITNQAILEEQTQIVIPPYSAAVTSFDQPEKPIKNVDAQQSTTNGSPQESIRLLIVEDNPDLMQFIASCLQTNYELLFARNGQEGIDQALEHIPDIIISDIMMPEVDGYELCRTLKQEERTCHIPIILLTAKADMTSKLEGLEYGADAYLIKPIHPPELTLRLRKLIELRRRLQAKFQQGDGILQAESQQEDPILDKARQLVLDNLENSDFGVDELSSALYMHRAHLHRKLKSLTGKSTTHFIRKIRLHAAYRLLQAGGRSVKEVTYAVGYSDPSYFTKLFKEEFGQSPSKI